MYYQLGIKAAPDSTLKQLITCGVSNTCTLLFFLLTFLSCCHFQFLPVQRRRNLERGRTSMDLLRTSQTRPVPRWRSVCRSDNLHDSPRIMWAEFATNPSGAIISDGTTILPGYINQDRYRIIHDTDDQYDLEITNLVLEDGGLFVCQDVNLGAGVYRGKAENTVLGKKKQ